MCNQVDFIEKTNNKNENVDKQNKKIRNLLNFKILLTINPLIENFLK